MLLQKENDVTSHDNKNPEEVQRRDGHKKNSFFEFLFFYFGET